VAHEALGKGLLRFARHQQKMTRVLKDDKRMGMHEANSKGLVGWWSTLQAKNIRFMVLPIRDQRCNCRGNIKDHRKFVLNRCGGTSIPHKL
jgi:uncharacterized protein YjaZ